MNLEPLAYSLPSTQSFVHSIADNDDNGVQVVLLPDNLSRDMVGRLVRNRLAALRLTVSRLFDPEGTSPVSASAKAMNAIWPSPRTLRTVHNLLCCTDLPDILYVHRIGSRQEWTEFIESWAREYRILRNSGNTDIPSLCVIAKLKDFDFILPESKSDLTFHWWWGFPSMLEVRLSCRIASEQFGRDDPATSSWREYVLPGLVGSDIQLAEHMWSGVLDSNDQTMRSLSEYWERLEDTALSDSIDDVIEIVRADRGTYGAGQELPQHLRRLWASGGLIYTREYGLEVHPALLAHRERWTSVEHMLWRGQSELLLPIVNEIRLRVCQDLTETYGSDWPVKWVPPHFEHDFEEVSRSPLGTELSHVSYLIQNLGMYNHRHDLHQKRFLGELVLMAKTLRNEIAHYNPVSYREFAGLCDERNRVGI